MKGGLVLMKPPSRPQLRDLLRVIAVGQSQKHDGLVLTLLALEVYTDGCLLTVLLQRARSVQEPADQFARMETVEVTMMDDQGGAYTGELHGHSGSSWADFWQGRGQCICRPTLDPQARALRIEIPSIGWTYWKETEQGEMRTVPGELTKGPWIFSIQYLSSNT